MHPKLVVVKEGFRVQRELHVLGLNVDLVSTIARRAAAAKAEALAIDPASAPGTLAYIHGVRAIRLALIPLGWKLSRDDNVESTVNHEMGIQLCFQNVDVACSERDPQSISGKGSGSRRLIHEGQIEMFERRDPKAGDALGSVPTVWYVCVSTDGGRLRAEVSCPRSFKGNQFEKFNKRIWVLDEDLEPAPLGVDRSDDGDRPVEHEVRISRK